MSITVALTLAKLVMGHLEEEIYCLSRISFGQTLHSYPVED